MLAVLLAKNYSRNVFLKSTNEHNKIFHTEELESSNNLPLLGSRDSLQKAKQNLAISVSGQSCSRSDFLA